MEWSLPQNGKPGKWHRLEGELSMCERGFHLTREPLKWYKWGCTAYLAEADGIQGWKDDKCVCRGVRLLREEIHPQWWIDTVRFVSEEIPKVRWFQNHEPPRPEWRLFDARGAARDAARDAAWGAARGAARDAAWEAAWGAAWGAARGAARDAAWEAAWDAMRDAIALKVTAGLDVPEEHRTILRNSWQVWEMGYGLAAEVGGVLYVYRRP